LKERHPDEEDFDKAAWRELLRNPPPNAAGHGKQDLFASSGGGNSIGSALDSVAIGHFDQWTTRDRFKQLGFTARDLETHSLWLRGILFDVADYCNGKAKAAQHATAPAQVTQRNDIPFAFEDATFTELEPVAVTIHR